MGDGGGGRWTDRDKQEQTNLPLQLLRSWGHNNAKNVQVLALTLPQFMTILSFDLQV